MTGQELVVQRIVERLTVGLPAPFSPVVPPPTGMLPPHRSVTRALDEDELPTYAVMVVQNNEDDEEGEGASPEGPWKRVVWIYVEARITGPETDVDGAADKYLDPWVDYAHTVLLSDPQLGGAANRIEPERTVYEGYDGDRVYLAAAMLFRVYYFGNPI